MALEAAFSEVVKDCGGASVPLMPYMRSFRRSHLRPADDFARM